MLSPKPKEVCFPVVEIIAATTIIKTGLCAIRHGRILAVLFMFCLLFHTLTAAAQCETGPEVVFNNSVIEKGVPADWTLKVHKGKAEIQLVNDTGERVLYMKSVKSAFTLLRDMVVDVREYPYLDWAWKALFLPSRSDVREESTDDRALQLCLVFKDRSVLCYVWDSHAPEGTVVEQYISWPLSLNIKTLVVKSGGSDVSKWVTFDRNIHEDYRRLFQKEPPMIEIVSLYMNTQQTGESAEGLLRNIVFRRTPSQPSLASLK